MSFEEILDQALAMLQTLQPRVLSGFATAICTR